MFWEYSRQQLETQPKLEYVPGKPQHMVASHPYETTDATSSTEFTNYPFPGYISAHYPFFLDPSMFIEPYFYYPEPYRYYFYPIANRN